MSEGLDFIFSMGGVNPFWECDICRNRILSAGEAQASCTQARRGGFTHDKCSVTTHGEVLGVYSSVACVCMPACIRCVCTEWEDANPCTEDESGPQVRR